MAGDVAFVGEACVSGAGGQTWPRAWLGCGRMAKLGIDGGTRASGYITWPALVWPTGAASADGVTFLEASSRRSPFLRFTPGENLIFRIGRWRPSEVVSFLEAPFCRPDFVMGCSALCILPWVCVLCVVVVSVCISFKVVVRCLLYL